MLAAGLPAVSSGVLLLPVAPHNVIFSQDNISPIIKMSLPDASPLDPTMFVPLSAEDPKWGSSMEEEDVGWNEETSDGEEDEGYPFRWLEGLDSESLSEEAEKVYCEGEEQNDEEDDSGLSEEDHDEGQSEGISDEDDEFYNEEQGEEADDERISHDSDDERPDRESDPSMQVHDADDVGQGEEADDEQMSDEGWSEDDESTSDTMKAAGGGGLDEVAAPGARPWMEVCGEGSCGSDEVGQAAAARDFSVWDYPAGELRPFPSAKASHPSISPARPTTQDAPATSRQVTEDAAEGELKKVLEELRQDLHVRATLFRKIICDGLDARHR